MSAQDGFATARVQPGRALLTGASGFVGEALCRRLLDDGWQVRAPLRRRLPDDLLGRIQTVHIDDLAAWSAAPGDTLHGIDTVFHLAASVHRHGLRDDDRAFARTNVDASIALARAARVARVRRVVFVSSIKAMGETSGPRALRPDDPARPEDAYGRSKLAAEHGMRAALEGGPTSLCIVRPPLVYGIGARANLDRLVRWLARGRPLPLASVDNRRSLIARENLADVLARVAGGAPAGGRVLLPADSDWSTPALVRALAAAIDRRAVLVPFPVALLRRLAGVFGQADRIDSLTASLQVEDPWLRTEAGWRPSVEPRESLAAMARAALAAPGAP